MDSATNRQNWETRSITYKGDLKSVLFKRFPEALNEHLHNFHTRFILDNIPNHGQIKVLDIGCGYGRNSISLLNRNDKIEIAGLDISANFIHQYFTNTGKVAYMGSIEDFPIQLGKFDYMLCITTLMYVEPKKVPKGVQNIFCHLTPNGSVILIEPLYSGKYFSNGFGLLHLFKNKLEPKTEYCFHPRTLKRLIFENSGIIAMEKRMPVTTLFIIPIFLLAKIIPKTPMTLLLKIVSKFDHLTENLRLPSLYIGLLVKTGS